MSLFPGLPLLTRRVRTWETVGSSTRRLVPGYRGCKLCPRGLSCWMRGWGCTECGCVKFGPGPPTHSSTADTLAICCLCDDAIFLVTHPVRAALKTMFDFTPRNPRTHLPTSIRPVSYVYRHLSQRRILIVKWYLKPLPGVQMMMTTFPFWHLQFTWGLFCASSS